MSGGNGGSVLVTGPFHPIVTAEDIRRQLESSASGTGIPGQIDLGLQNLLSSMATAAQSSLLEGCPIFIDRLRTNPKLAQRIKEMMQNWGKEEE